MTRLRRRLPLAVWFGGLTVWLLMTLLCSRADAEEPRGPVPPIRRLGVRADQPDTWPKGNWVPIPADEFETLYKKAQPNPPAPQAVQINRAEYSAILVGDTLREGRFSAQVRSNESTPQFLSLDPWNLAVSHLAWAGREAVWGTTRDGTTVVLVDRPEGELTATWSRRGRARSRSLEFDLSVAPAAVSVIDLRLPEDRVLESSVGETVRLRTPEEAGWSRWRVELGSETSCRLTILSAAPPSTGPPRVLFEQDTNYALGEANLRFQSSFNVEVLDRSTQELAFVVPTGVEVYSISYGQETPLSWTQSPEQDDHRTLHVRLPDPLLGRSRPIRVDGIAPVGRWRPMVLPRVTLRNALFLQGQIAVAVAQPLQVRNFEVEGCRQSAAVSRNGSEETYTFQQLLPHARLSIDVRRPEPLLTARVLSLLQLDEGAWQLASEIEWTAGEGSAFTVACQMPPEWEVTDVQAAATSPDDRLATWDVQPTPKGAVLTLEFVNALPRGQSRHVRVLARRRAPYISHAALPIIQPLQTASVETLLALIQPSSAAPVLGSDSTFEPVPAGNPPTGWTGFSLGETLQQHTHDALWVHGDGGDVPGSFSVQARLRPVDVEVRAEATIQGRQLTEHYSLHCRSDDEPLDRLLVYLTTAGPQPEWRVRGSRRSAVTAVRLPVERHAEWNYPETGELWEVRLPRHKETEIVLEATRSRAFVGSTAVGLLFVPQAQRFRGTIAVGADDPFGFDVREEGLEAVDEPGSPAANHGRPSLARRMWRYVSPTNSLTLDWHEATQDVGAGLWLNVEQDSLIAAGVRGSDLHRVRFDIENAAGQDQFRFVLPPPASLLSMTLDGQPVRPARLDEEYVVAGLADRPRATIEVNYEGPAAGRADFGRRRIPLPQVVYPVLAFTWDFSIPPDAVLAGTPSGMHLVAEHPSVSWTKRLFGPWGRSFGSEIFNPFRRTSWQALFQWRSDRPHPVAMPGEFPVPADWQTFRAAAGSLPASLDIQTSSASRLQTIAWLSFFGCLTAGILLRLARVRYRARIGLTSLILFAAAAFVVPPVYAEIVGGCLLGTAVALLLPRRLLFPVRRPDQAAESRSGSSLYRQPVSVGLVLVAGLLVARAAAQEPPHREASPAAEPIDILIPLDANLSAPAKPALVYAPETLLSQLRTLAKNRPAQPEYLIAEADYRGRLDGSGVMTCTARYRVAVFPADGDPIEVTLPLSGVSLGGEEACRVNGRPHPLSRDLNDRFVVAVDPSEIPADALAVANRSGERSVAARWIELQLELHQPVRATPSESTVRATIPPVAASHAAFVIEAPSEAFQVRSAQGETRIHDRSVEAELGPTDQLDLSWSLTPLLPKPSQIENHVAHLVEAHPTRLVFHTEIRCRVLAGSPDYVDWRLPRGILVRSLSGDVVLRHSSVRQADESIRLGIELTEPQSQDFTLRGEFLLPLHPDGDRLHVPVGFPTPRADDEALGHTFSAAIGASSDLRLEPLMEATAGAKWMLPEDFLRTWTQPVAIRPTAAYEVSADQGIDLRWELPRPQRTVRLDQLGQIRRRTIDWTLSAEVETATTPVFEHRLSTDPALRVTSVSVLEDGAERLVRWSASRPTSQEQEITLFLSGKTNGIQNVVFKGTVAVRPDGASVLPAVRFRDATVAASQLVLIREPDVFVEVPTSSGLNRLESDPSPENAGQMLVGQFALEADAPSIPIRSLPRRGKIATRSVTMLHADSTDAWRQATWLELRSLDGRRQPFSLTLPAELAGVMIDFDDATHEKHINASGETRVMLVPRGEDNVTATVMIRGTVTPRDGSATIWRPHLADARDAEEYLVLAPASTLRLSGDADALDPASLPAWAREVLAAERLTPPFDLFEGDQADWTVTRGRTDSTSHEIDVALVEHRVWIDRPAHQYGLTSFVLNSADRTTLPVHVPGGVELRAVWIDGHPLPPAPRGEQFLIPLEQASSGTMISVFWKREGSETRWLAERQDLLLPSLDAVPVAETLVSIVPTDGMSLFGRSSSPRMDRIPYESLRLRQWLNVPATEQQGVDSPRRSLVRRSSEQLRSSLPRDRTLSATDREALANLLQRAESETSHGGGETAAPAMMSVQLQDFPGTLRLHPSDPAASLGVWMISRRLIALLIALPLVLLALPVVWRLARLEPGERMSRHPRAACLLLGLIWWLALAPSVLGFVLCLAALTLAIRERITSRRPTAALPSTIDQPW